MCCAPWCASSCALCSRSSSRICDNYWWVRLLFTKAAVISCLPHHRKCKTLGAALTFQRDFKNESGGSRSCLPYSGTFLSPFFVLLCIPSTPCYCPVVAAAGWISFAIESASLVEEKMLLRWMNDTHPNPIPSEARPTPPSNDVKGAFLK